MARTKKTETPEAVEVVEAETPEAEPLPEYAVAAGKSVTCKRGVVADGDEVTEADFLQGAADLETLVKMGAVVRNES